MSDVEDNPAIVLNIDVIRCEDGGFVGGVREWPIVAQADTINDLKGKITGAIGAYIMHHQDEVAESMPLKVAA